MYELNEKIYIFDLDGTLVDSMRYGVELSLGFLKKNGIAYPDDIVTNLTPLGFRGVAKYYEEHFGTKMSADEIFAYFQECLTDVYTHQIPAKNNVEKALKVLKSKGCRLNVLTASPHDLTDACLKRLGLYDLFENVWTIEDFATTKADPKIYDEVARLLNAKKAECIMVDDNLHVLQTAKGAGMRTIGVFDETSAETELQMRAISDKYITDFAELI
ncbi:MAG: HAD family phosphatase [Clostridiales bacterium]|nr:HAD family phosphatase [Clostridiales bacterium]